MSATAHHVDGYDLDDQGLEPPTKLRRMIVETTATYVVWVEDYDDRGVKGLEAYWNEDPTDLSDLIRNEMAVDAGITLRAPDGYDLLVEHQEELGPWQVCPFPGCTTVQYPAYSIDPTCHRHRVTGCQFRNLLERTFE